jgi:phosphatidylglycerol:prolipoprotein diacylglycerol transferase
MFASPGSIAFQIGPLAVRWYGLLIAAGVMLGTTLAHREALRRGEDPDKLLNLIVVVVLSALLGARLYYVLFNWAYYGTQPSKVFAIWEGGLAIHGGLIAGALATLLYCRTARLSVLATMDIMAPSVAIGQAIGRWGNFFNQEAFGTPTDLPWRLYIDPYHRPPSLKGFEYFHPTFLYESLWNLLVFCVLWCALRKRLADKPGALTLSYLGLYSLGRFFVEGLRIDSLMLGSLRAAQVVSLLLVAVSGIGLAVLLRKR